MRYRGAAYRAHDPRWSFKPLSGDGAAIYGGRFNPRGTPALYLALDPMTAIREANQGFAHKIEPLVLCTYEIDCDDLVDVRDAEGRMSIGVEADELAGAWFDFIARGEEPPTWAIARRLIEKGAAGLLVRSFAPGAQPHDHNLALWHWGPKSPHKLAVFDPSGRLPKNQLSWT